MNKLTREKYILLAEFLHKTLGSEYEIVLYDFSNGKYSIAYKANEHISLNNMADPLSDSIIKFADNNNVASENNYIISNQGVAVNNRVIRSSSFFIKDDMGNLSGMLCINFDGSKHINLAKQMLQLIHMDNASIENEKLYDYDFFEDLPYVISMETDKALADTLKYADIPVERLTQEEKMDVVRQLHQKGIFMLKGAVSEVAEKLAVSEATMYRYIKSVSNGE